MKLEVTKPKEWEYRSVRIGTNQYGRKYIEAVEVKTTSETVVIERRGWLETVYLCSVTLIGCWVGWTIMH